MPGVAIVTDSTSDLDAAARGRDAIDVVPLFVHFGETRYRDGDELGRDQFYDKLAASAALPTTSQPTPAMFEAAFRPHVEAGRTVVCLTVMESLSGTLNAAHAAAGAFPAGSVRVVDSESVCGGLALQAIHAARLAQGGSGVDEILAALAADRARQRGYATVPDLSHAVRTGRVTRAQAFIGSLIKIVPVLRIDGGRIAEEARVRTFARALDAMLLAAARAMADAGETLACIVHTRVPELAATLAERLWAAAPVLEGPPEVVEAGPVIATHAGTGALGIFVLPL
jgi:DegV family protein with EDD domain